MVDNSTTLTQSIMDKIRSQETPLVTEGAVHQAKYVSAILKSCLGRWFLLHAGKTIPIHKPSPSEERVMVYLVDKMLSAGPETDTSYIEEDLEWMVCKLYGLTDEERVAVTTSQWDGLPPLTEEEEDIAMLRAIEEGQARENDEEFLKHEEMMQKLLGQDEC